MLRNLVHIHLGNDEPGEMFSSVSETYQTFDYLTYHLKYLFIEEIFMLTILCFNKNN